MAHQQPYQAYPTNKGTLIPGQTISVNQYEVQVERYLSQGGFAHVYLVQTAKPVYNTTHHVLKRIAVQDEAMLTDVKKEVDIMRILKGHPNIVHLIDAAWHKLPTGMYEVFILMEFCAGGGIIDMMNRRLRERLTEAEILGIFVDVLEGVAAMHNLKPPLLHRDLKVENILQASPTSFKLCDFGSATSVGRVPTSVAEIRALEADLNRHTTLQYRAPEMVDLYLHRPVDEKSDVWALGVLLYKLCYYTTPFEEHGPLAILNVQYRIPPYPVYSAQMNSLIASMLVEHGTRRPHVFELLNHVHNLRGTRSRFKYVLPAPAPPLSPRRALAPTTNTNTNPLDDLVSFRPSGGQGKNAGVQAREKVLEAIAPMRRGRPVADASSSRSASPSKSRDTQRPAKNLLDDDFEAEWKNVKGHASGAARPQPSGAGNASDAWKVRSSPAPPVSKDDAWNMNARGGDKKPPSSSSGLGGFDNNFAEKLWDSFDGRPMPSKSPALPPQSQAKPASVPSSSSRFTPSKSKDAFEGLGIASSDRLPAPTLGEARKLRTGLASIPTQASSSSGVPYSRPTPSPRPSPVPPSVSPAWKSNQQAGDQPAESRFPSLEELDATFPQPISRPVPPPHAQSQPTAHTTTGGGLRPPASRQGTYSQDGVRSEQVTGIAMRDPKSDGDGKRAGRATPSPTPVKEKPAPSATAGGRTEGGIGRVGQSFARPTLSRKHRSSISIKHRQHSGGSTDLFSPHVPASPSTQRSPTKHQPDWLTGDDVGDMKPPGTPVLRESPSKRSSYIEEGGYVKMPVSPRAQSAVVERSPSPSKMSQRPASRTARPLPSTDAAQRNRNAVVAAPSAAPPSTKRSPPSTHRMLSKDSSSSDDIEDGPEDASGYFPPAKEASHRRKGKGRQSSVHDLVDLYGGRQTGKEKDKEFSQSISRQPESPTKERQKATDPARALGSAFNDFNASNGQSRRSTMLGSASTTYRSSSPQSLTPQPTPTSQRPLAVHTGNPDSNRSSRPPASAHKKQSSVSKAAPASPAPNPSRSTRPQSMFVFPAAKSESAALPSPGLMPPPEQKPRAERRTSISDMVQRYEAIGVPRATPSPSVAMKSTGLKVSTQAANAASAMNGRMHTGGPYSPATSRTSEDRTSSNITRPSGRTLPVPNNSTGDPSKPTRSVSGLPSPSPVDKGDSANYVSGLPPRTSYRTSDPSSPSRSYPVRRSATPSDENPPETPSSPDRPYQGVGKLIDQWQRKTVEPDQRGGRGGYPLKRAGLTSGGGGRGR
ncbi:hypothetical protein PLICRDRAFT_411608 [Plicaturopsis crispa FD-325 SS-3]|nr:hypothetical protein PLICRDRAFT_411608 [Plicaturopsis crispa FD-325 SS-3]